MRIALVILVIALILGGVGLFMDALGWLLFVALALFVVSALTGWRSRSI